MREIVLDTETTGFDPKTGDRMVEIGAIELVNHMPTRNATCRRAPAKGTASGLTC